jgi:hypothetical protein
MSINAMQGAVETAKGVLDVLERKLHATHARLADAEALASAIAYRSHADNDPEARKRLAVAEADGATLAIEIKSISAAIVTAKQHVALADAGEVDEAERTKAQAALDLLETFAKRGAALDEAFDAALAEYAALSKEFRELERLGFAPSTPALVRVNMGLAASTKLLFTDMQNTFLAPAQRRSFVETIEAWSSAVRSRAKARLARTNKAAEAA